MRLQIIFATGNEGKVREIREIISDPELTIQTMKEAGVAVSPEENGQTFEENAMIKARAVWEKVRENPACILNPEVPVVVMSDDSGLCIDALDGAPGVQSARFMGHDTSYDIKMNAILEKLRGIPDRERTARFTAAVAAIFPEGLDPRSDSIETLTALGHMEGMIGHEIAGSNGFGYDPIFYIPELERSSAEITSEEKNALSHRGKAVRAMMDQLQRIAHFA